MNKISLVIIEFCVRCGLSGLIQYTFKHLFPKSKIYISRAATMKEYVHKTHSDSTIEYIGGPRQRIYSLPSYDGQIRPVQTVETAPLYIAKLKNISIIGGSDLLITTDGYGINDMFASDTKHRLRFNGRAFKGTVSNTRIISIVPNGKLRKIKKGVMLSANFSLNYFHFTIEILPRFQHLDGHVPADVPLIIDSNMTRYPQFEELLKYFNRSNRAIVVVEAEKVAFVEELYYPSIAPYIVPDIKHLAGISPIDSLYDTEALDFVRAKMLQIKSGTQYPSKIFLYRQGGVRNFNQDQVFDQLERLGFVKISTDKMSVADQVSLFNGASVVVTGSGAALTNILYCTENCRVLVIVRSTFEQITIFSSIASHVGVHLRYVSAELATTDDPMILHQEFQIDPTKIIDLVK